MRHFKKWTAFVLAGIMLLTGCGAVGDSSAGGASGEGQSTEASSEEQSMGRYLEKEIVLPEEVTAMSTYPMAYLQKLDSGNLELVEKAAGKYISKDNGETWEHEETPWLSGLWEKGYISDLALAPDGGMAVAYSPYTDSEEDVSESIYQREYIYADSQGNTKNIEFQESDNYLHQFWFGKDSSLYAYDLNCNVYAVDKESGSVKKLFQTEGLSDYVCFTEKYMVIIGSRGITVYDLEEEMVAEEDVVLADFISENLGDNIGANSDGHEIVAVEGEQEDVIYFACSKGLYRHVIGGTAVEQVVDGTITSLGDPMMMLRGMALLPDNEFAVLYNDVKLYRYVYDPDIPTVPEKQLGVYSLEEDYTIRQAVSLFQKQNPDVYIRYEVGLSGDNGMTAEDAIKNLNTKLMSGYGPDILILDGLPADSYKEKGILEDLTSLEAEMTGEDSLFSNLVDACREDGKLYALPVRFQLPMMAGDEELLGKITDLKSLADNMEELRGENPEGSLLGVWSEEEVLYTLGLTSSAAWVNEEGQIDEEKLTEFLTQANRIYQAELAGLDEAEVQRHQDSYEENWSTDVTGEGHYYANTSGGALDIAMGTQKFALGRVKQMNFDYNMLTTLAEKEENFAYGPWQGQIQNGFIPSTMAGICTGAADNEMAGEFYRFLFGRELQDLDLPGGFPMNMASFDSFLESPYADEVNGGIAIADDQGDMYSLDVV